MYIVNKMYCSPYHEHFFKKHKTCFSKAQLVNIAEQMQLPNHKNLNKIQLWSLINQHMWKSKKCNKNDETCWIDKGNLNIIPISNAHIPIKPSSWKNNPRTWLSNIDILQILSQYEKKYTKFNFIGVFPIDFANSNLLGGCVSQALCNIKFNFSTHNKFAAVFNTDKHYQSGSHWICFFANTNPRSKNFGFFFFDSNGLPCPTEIKALFESFHSQLKIKKFAFYENHIQKQFKNTECGMFCIHFIIQLLKNKSFHSVINEKVYDDDVFKLRNVLFRD
jgi:hypothetical protein